MKLELPSNYWSLNYREPQSAMAEVVQRPLYLISTDAVLAAYFKDSAKARKEKTCSTNLVT